jgi:hypothetical protein
LNNAQLIQFCSWRSESEALMEILDEETGSTDHSSLNLFSSLLNKMEELRDETVSFDSDKLSLNWHGKQTNSVEQTRATRKASNHKLPALSREFYK